MKKTLILIAAALLATTAMVACTPKDGDAAPDTNTADTVATASGYSMNVNGKTLYIGLAADSLETLLGTPNKTFEADSCAIPGNRDVVYTYGGLDIYTYTDGGKEYVNSMNLRDDTVTTPEGIYIGSAEADVIAKYGEGEKNDVARVYVKDGTKLAVFIKDGTVNAITYSKA